MDSHTESHVQRTISLSGGNFAVLEAGSGGRPLLLVHGFTGAKEDFAEHLDWLAADGWHVVAPDLRGHGSSPAPTDETDYSLSHFAADLDELIEAFGWDSLVLLGHSMGGMVVQVFAVAHPDQLEGLILMDTGHGSFDLEPGLAELGAELARTGGIGAVKEALDEMDDPLSNPAFERMVAERPGYQEFHDDKFLASSPAMYAALLVEITSSGSRLDALRSLDLRTLVLVGELDEPFLGPSHELAAAIDGAVLVVIPDAGHSPQFENPEAWTAAMKNFLTSL